MQTTKEILSIQVKHINELLRVLGCETDITVDYSSGLPSLRSHNGSVILATALTKPELQTAITAIKNILYEIDAKAWLEFRVKRTNK